MENRFENLPSDIQDASQGTHDPSKPSRLSRIQGGLIGGAVGDALGYPVEFMSRSSICDTFGPEGIRSYWLSETGGTALFSDDTQMTLFTASGLLQWRAVQLHSSQTDQVDDPVGYIYGAYLDWLHTQDRFFAGNPGTSSLLDVRELYAHRAPGNTCLSALRSGEMGTMEHALNDSKGCGGVMRVAPIGLMAHVLDNPWLRAAEAAAITHSHPMGYIPSAALARLVELGVSGAASLPEAVQTCCAELPEWFPQQRYHAKDMAAQLRRAADLAAGDAPDYDNVVRLGEGWCGDEALAIAVYCCLRHADSFDEAIIAAVNHGGDSDSTGAVAGNILGAFLGIEAIGNQWTDDLELRDLILGLASDLCGC